MSEFIRGDQFAGVVETVEYSVNRLHLVVTLVAGTDHTLLLPADTIMYPGQLGLFSYWADCCTCVPSCDAIKVNLEGDDHQWETQ